ARGTRSGSAASGGRGVAGGFWDGAMPNCWDEIAQPAALSRGLTPAETARLFPLLGVAIPDSVIAFYDAKYTYAFWRPVTAIRAADTRRQPGDGRGPELAPAGGQDRARSLLSGRARRHQRCRRGRARGLSRG